MTAELSTDELRRFAAWCTSRSDSYTEAAEKLRADNLNMGPTELGLHCWELEFKATSLCQVASELTDILGEDRRSLHRHRAPHRVGLMAGFRNYGNRRIQAGYDFKSIREEIYRDFKSEIESEIRCERITELEARIANLNATISQCHKRIQELEDEAREPS